MASAPAHLWREARTAEGRPYYFNTQTNATQWEKPEALMSPSEMQSVQLWREYTTDQGRKYWYNTLTKDTTWTMPEGVRSQPKNSLPPRPAVVAPTFVAGGGSAMPQYGQPKERDGYGYSDRGGYDRPSGYATEGRSSIQFASQFEINTSPEEAEALFMKVLKRVGVQVDWTWDQAMRAAITDPQYLTSIKDPKDRKAAYEKYIVEARLNEKEKEKERLQKLRTDFRTMLSSHPEIKYYSRWKTIREIIKDEAIFRAAKGEEERRQLFEEYVLQLRKTHDETQVADRKQAKIDLDEILKALQLEPYTSWEKAQQLLSSNEDVLNNPKFKTLHKEDTLLACEAHIRLLEQELNKQRQKEIRNKRRQERQNRDHFKELLSSLRKDGHIKAGSKWMDILPMIKDDPRFLNMLGQRGSTPLDLFRHMVEEEESTLRWKRNQAYDVLEDHRFEVTLKTTFDQFKDIMRNDKRTSNFDPESLSLIYERIVDKVKKRDEEDKHQADRLQRRAVENLRYRIRHLEPPVRVGETWEQVRPRVEKTEEYRAITTDELRRSAFDKVMRRLLEKDDDRPRERSKRDHRDHRDRDRERDRRERDRDQDRDHRDHRDHRNGDGEGRRRHRTSTPAEPDAYEAERRKAQADRERQYRDRTGLTPPLRRERDERDRYERSSVSRQLSSSHYDRERREREAERERSYISRADPRDRSDELDYGDSRPSSMRRRRESDGASAEGMRDSKRTRREKETRERTHSPNRKSRSKTPLDVNPPKEEPGYHSGSEEGEIEED